MSEERPTTALFAYGSLVDIESAAATLGHRPAGPWAATLRGWRRAFSLLRDNRRSEKTFARRDDGSVPEWILSLTLEPAGESGTAVNGALIAVDEADLARLDLREIRYERRDVSGEVATVADSPAFDRIVAYVARPENHAPRAPAGAVVLRSYVDAVEDAFARLGAGELMAFRRSTMPRPVPVVEGRLVRDEIPAGNPRRW